MIGIIIIILILSTVAIKIYLDILEVKNIRRKDDENTREYLAKKLERRKKIQKFKEDSKKNNSK